MRRRRRQHSRQRRSHARCGAIRKAGHVWRGRDRGGRQTLRLNLVLLLLLLLLLLLSECAPAQVKHTRRLRSGGEWPDRRRHHARDGRERRQRVEVGHELGRGARRVHSARVVRLQQHGARERAANRRHERDAANRRRE